PCSPPACCTACSPPGSLRSAAVLRRAARSPSVRRNSLLDLDPFEGDGDLLGGRGGLAGLERGPLPLAGPAVDELHAPDGVPVGVLDLDRDVLPGGGHRTVVQRFLEPLGELAALVEAPGDGDLAALLGAGLLADQRFTLVGHLEDLDHVLLDGQPADLLEGLDRVAAELQAEDMS